MSPPRVSVITIFLNGEQYLGEAIDSVLAQSFGDFELLLCDDGSGEAAAALACGYAERFGPKVRYLEHPGHVNRGMSLTRNLGIAQAQGEFIAFIDADDVWRRDKLAEQVAILDAHSGTAMVCGAVNYWHAWAGGEDEVIPTGPEFDAPMPPPEALLGIYPLGPAPAPCPSDLLLRTDAVRGIGGFEAQFPGMYEDQAFLAKMYFHHPVFFSSTVWLDYRQHPESCVAESHRSGRYHEVRSVFLRWFRAYVEAQPVEVDARVAASIALAIRRERVARLRHDLRRRPRQAAARVIEGLRRRLRG